MGLGVLEDRKLKHVPGSYCLSLIFTRCILPAIRTGFTGVIADGA